jgi:predicted N-acetyltransferase YhbS
MCRTPGKTGVKMADNDCKIRLARPDDLLLIQEVERAAGKMFTETEFSFVADAEPMAIEWLRKRQGEDQVWVAVDEGDKPTAYAVIEMVDGLVHLHEISVHPAQGRKGIGKKLIHTVCEWAKQTGKSAVTLSTFRDVAWNAPYYGRLGFRIVDEAELTEGLRAIRKHEALLGLPIEKRVCMRKEV